MLSSQIMIISNVSQYNVSSPLSQAYINGLMSNFSGVKYEPLKFCKGDMTEAPIAMNPKPALPIIM